MHTLALIEKMKAQKVNPFTTSESQEAMFINNEKPVEEKLPVRRAKWYSDPKIKKQVLLYRYNLGNSEDVEKLFHTIKVSPFIVLHVSSKKIEYMDILL